MPLGADTGIDKKAKAEKQTTSNGNNSGFDSQRTIDPQTNGGVLNYYETMNIVGRKPSEPLEQIADATNKKNAIKNSDAGNTTAQYYAEQGKKAKLKDTLQNADAGNATAQYLSTQTGNVNNAGGGVGGGGSGGAGVVTGGSTAQQQSTVDNSVTQEAAGAQYVAKDANGNSYYIGSDKGANFITGAANGSTITGGDGSTWVKNADGTVTITDKDGKTYTIKGGSVESSTPTATTNPASDYYNNGKSYLDQAKTLAEQQAKLQSQYAVDQGVAELQRAEGDAQATFKANQEQIAAQGQNALDNSALYAEARGDKGGIGQAQYNSIQNAMAVNTQSVKTAQTQLSTDTARQIADLRAQGEFETADALLTIAQNYLSQLNTLYQSAMSYGLSVEQFETSKAQWQAEFEASVASLTGTYQGQTTLAQKQNIAEMAMTMLQAGYEVGDEQIAAIKSVYGLTDAGIADIVNAAKISGSGSGGTTSSSTGDLENGSEMSNYDRLYMDAMTTSSPYDYISTYYKSYGLTSKPSESAYKSWLENENNFWYYDPYNISDIAKGMSTDLTKMEVYADAQKKLNKIIEEYENGSISMDDRNWLLTYFGLN